MSPVFLIHKKIFTVLEVLQVLISRHGPEVCDLSHTFVHDELAKNLSA